MNIDTFVEEISHELRESCNQLYSSPIEIKKHERNHGYLSLSVPYIFSLYLHGIGNVEIILCRDLERIFDFDISIRHFYSFKENEVVAASFALKDISRRELSIVSPVTPKSFEE